MRQKEPRQESDGESPQSLSFHSVSHIQAGIPLRKVLSTLAMKVTNMNISMLIMMGKQEQEQQQRGQVPGRLCEKIPERKTQQ